jgi:hypothetical protein
MWQHEPLEIKTHYQRLAEEAKLRHRYLYPEYIYTPRKASDIKKRKRNSKEGNATKQRKNPRLAGQVQGSVNETSGPGSISGNASN